MTTEAALQNEIRLALSRAGCTMFRQNTGQAWTGRSIERLPGGAVLIHDARPITFGLTRGSSDLIGWRSVMLDGRPAAVFCAVEVKSTRGRATAEQVQFIERIQADGGMAGIARSVDDALRICRIP